MVTGIDRFLTWSQRVRGVWEFGALGVRLRNDIRRIICDSRTLLYTNIFLASGLDSFTCNVHIVITSRNKSSIKKIYAQKKVTFTTFWYPNISFFYHKSWKRLQATCIRYLVVIRIYSTVNIRFLYTTRTHTYNIYCVYVALSTSMFFYVPKRSFTFYRAVLWRFRHVTLYIVHFFFFSGPISVVMGTVDV